MGVISNEVADSYYANYGFMVKKPSVFSSFWKKLKAEEDAERFILVKQLSIQDVKEAKNDI